MKVLRIVFADQLSLSNLVINNINKDDFLLFYEPLDTFYEIRHHKHKITLLISSLRKLVTKVKHTNILHHKITKKNNQNLKDVLFEIVDKNNINKIMVSKPSDFKIYKDLLFFSQSNNIELEILEDKKFISNVEDFTDWASDKKTRIQEYYYRWLRKKYNIFMNQEGKPIGDKWNFDKDNRKGIKQLKSDIPERKKLIPDQITFDAMVDVEECFPNSIGTLENFNWATTHEEAENLLDDFIERFLVNYGAFQDAINKENTFMFHSLLSPYLNCGLLDPEICIQKAEKKYYESNGEIPINSVEGFIRQILGWREFIKGVYWENMPKYKNLNYWSHSLKLNDNWYDGDTGIPPLDDAIKESKKFAYSHHINRLMIIANLMNLTGIHPNEMYRWFMEMYIDAYDWVMVPNVYGMGSYADGGIFSTKPYICGSSYMLRMSNYSKGDWCDTVDGLYWRFVEKNIKFFESNPRLAVMTRSLTNMNKERKKTIFKSAEEFIDRNTA
jgi:deoxyribodipyrimidine photolyase-related protein